MTQLTLNMRIWLRNAFIDLGNDNMGLSSDEIAKKANALRKCVTNVIDLNGLNDTKTT